MKCQYSNCYSHGMECKPPCECGRIFCSGGDSCLALVIKKLRVALIEQEKKASNYQAAYSSLLVKHTSLQRSICNLIHP